MGRRIGAILFFSGLLIAGGLFAGWRTLTRLPDWYDPAQTQQDTLNVLTQEDFNDVQERDDLTEQLKQKLEPVLAPPTQTSSSASSPTVTLDEKTVNELIVASAHQSQDTQPYLNGIRGIKTEITPQQIKSEIVINFTQVDRDRLPETHVEVLEDLAQQFPMLADQDILLSFDGKPQIIAGQLQLNPDMNVAIGGFQMTLADLFQRFGVDVETTPLNLNLSDFEIQSLQYGDGELVITH